MNQPPPELEPLFKRFYRMGKHEDPLADQSAVTDVAARIVGLYREACAREMDVEIIRTELLAALEEYTKFTIGEE